MNQTEFILAWLREGHGLTPIEALSRFGCFRLAARISDAKLLLREDEEIVTELVRANGRKFARYSIVVREQSQMRLAL